MEGPVTKQESVSPYNTVNPIEAITEQSSARDHLPSSVTTRRHPGYIWVRRQSQRHRTGYWRRP